MEDGWAKIMLKTQVKQKACHVFLSPFFEETVTVLQRQLSQGHKYSLGTLPTH